MQQRIFQTLVILLTACMLSFPIPATASAVPLAVLNIEVDTTVDYSDLAHAACTPTSVDCSLRGAVRRANADLANYYIIQIPAGVYALSIPGQAENDNLTGDLDIRVSLTLHGAGLGKTFIQAGPGVNAGIDRVIHTIYPAGYSLSLSQLTVRYGKPPLDSYGGGIYVQGMYAMLLLDRVHVEYNMVVGSDGKGGGIYSTYQLVMAESMVAHNTAENQGGGIFTASYTGGISQITNSAIIANQAGDRGGGLMANSRIEIANTTISGNQAVSQGGGLALDGNALVLLQHVTLAYNTSSENTGWAVDNPLPLVLQNTLVVGGSAGSACSYIASIAAGSLGTDSSCGIPVISNPGLAPLALNGGLTLNHALITGSPAIDAGVNVHCLPIDQRGFPRPIDGNSDGTAACDVGAFESSAFMWLVEIWK